MKKTVAILLLIISVTGAFSQNRRNMKYDDYKSEWLKVAEFEKKSLPQSAGKAVDEILEKAVKENNSPQVIKALIHQGKYDLAVDNQDDTLVFENLTEMLGETNDVIEKSVINSMLGELYIQYFQSNSWTISQRTELGDAVPEDMKEWTRNIFFNKAVEHLNASIAAETELVKADVDSYAAVVNLGKDSRTYYPTMFDFLSRRAIDIYSQIDSDEDLSRVLARKGVSAESLFVPASEFVQIKLNPEVNEYGLWRFETYNRLLSSLIERDMSESVLLTELDLINSLQIFGNAYSLHAEPLLKRLLEQWDGEKMSVEIINNLVGISFQEKTEEMYDLLVKSISRYKSYKRISVLENRLAQITQPSLLVTGNNTFAIKGEKEINVTFRNLKSVKAKLYRVSSPLDVQMAESGRNYDLSGKRTFVKDISVDLPQTPQYKEGETTFNIDINSPGVYMLEFDTDPVEENSGWSPMYFFAVSDFAVFSRPVAKDKYDLFVVDRTTGEPVQNAEIKVYKLPGNWRNSKLTLEESITTNADGFAVYNKEISNNDVFYHVVKSEDRGSLMNRLPYAYYSYSVNDPKEREQLTIFTDRGLYRPGQTTHYKAILTRSNAEGNAIIADREVEITLRDANSRELYVQNLRTNEFGSVAGEFVLPQGLLPGNFSIESDNGSASIRVEEYKRPTFEVTFDKIEETYKFGEEVTLNGKAESFSGIKLQNAVVEWRITRQQSWWWMWGGQPEHYAEGIAMSDENGEFKIVFTPEKDDTQRLTRAIYSYAVTATVTDLNGETQVGSYTLTVGDISMVIQTDIASMYDKNGDSKINITAMNLDGASIEAAGTYNLYSLHDNDSVNMLVKEGEFVTGEQKELKQELSRLNSGKYRLKLVSKDDRGNPVEAENDFILFSYDDKRPPVETNDWFVVKNVLISPEEPAEVILGATGRVKVLYELWQEQNLVERNWIVIDNENRLFDFHYNEDFKEGLTLMLTFVKDEKFYSHNTELRYKKESENLNVKLDVFRDKIRPGSEEEWRVTVTDASGNPAMAEVLASMYDFSLDNIYPSQSWSLSPYTFNMYNPMRRPTIDQSLSSEYLRKYYSINSKSVVPFEFDGFNWFGFSFYNRGMLFRSSNSLSLNETVVVGFGQKQSAAAPAPDMLMVSEVAEEEAFSVADDQSGERDSSATDAPQIRSNFNETAFFYPQLMTNEKGETQIAFTVPESNTRWRFRVLAHDKNLKRGGAEEFTVSQKELMVTPNMPRFLRHGDKTTISTKISNLSDVVQSGNVIIEFFNPSTEEVITNISVDNREQTFSLEPGASSDADWTFDVPDNIDIAGIRIIAQSGQFSDGEQHALPVLPNRMLVTESLRMDVKGNETKSFVMERLAQDASDTRDDYRLTLEFTSNPAWYAVQALPVLGQPTSENAVSWFASYYANTLGAHIGSTYPKVSAMIEAWKKQGGNEETFLSNLEKNEELKSVLLEETPWVLEAENESEQKEKLSLLFDLNRSRNLTQTALLKLQDLQTNQGGWSWFKGFRPSVSITHYILYGFSQLTGLQAVEYNEDTKSMQIKAIGFIDAEAVERYEMLKKYNKDWKNIKSISTTDLEYLFVRRNYSDIPMDSGVRELYRFYISVIEKNWTSYGLYERSLIAQLMHIEGKRGVMNSILESYREHAVVSEEMGMYWPNNRASVFMSLSAVSVHTFIMDAFKIGGAAADEMDNMKQWLLKQKQTQMWETTHATMDAVYALLSGGSDWFTADATTSVTLGSIIVEPESSELGTGYFKETWGRGEISKEMANITVDHKGNTPAWGALYLQYFEDMDKIGKTDASLDIEKQLFVERTDADGTKLFSVTEENSLKVGDKVVVRLTVRTDRDMEFVNIKDVRAACFEPVNQLSAMRWQNGVPYYQTAKDASTNFYFDNLPRGTYVFEYTVFVVREGNYSNGISTIQSMYAPEFTSHTKGIRIIVN